MYHETSRFRAVRPLSRRRAVPRVESLESRCLLSAVPAVTSRTEIEPNDVTDHSLPLDVLQPGRGFLVTGVLGNSATGRADVDFSSFTLEQSSRVRIAVRGMSPSGGPAGVVTLYNSDPDEPSGHRLIAQAEGSAALGTVLTQTLAPGTYFVAVSGSGNRLFHPRLAGTGYPGATGAYRLTLSASNAGLPADSGPAVLSSNPVPGSVLAQSPLVLRVSLNANLDPGTVSAGSTVRLVASQDRRFGNADDTEIDLADAHVNEATHELLAIPMAPLRPGYYQLFLAGDESQHPDVLRGQDSGAPLGQNALSAKGKDFLLGFRISGIEGGKASDDVPGSAHKLGSLVGRRVQIAGTVGDDADDPAGMYNPSDTDLYHFRITGGRAAFAAEVFAGRIGSPLDPAITLFRRDTASGHLVLVASNANTANDAHAANDTLPLYTDAALYSPLEPGEYYIAVSSGFNYVDPAVGQNAGMDGIFDPTTSHSGQAGNTTGRYVLNLKAEPAGRGPSVTAASIAQGQVLTQPPQSFTVKFDAPVNLQALANTAYNRTMSSRISAVYITGDEGPAIYPRLAGYDANTNEATFQLVDALTQGSHVLHLSGDLGLTDLSGNPLRPNNGGTDYTILFTVAGAARGTPGSPTVWASAGEGDYDNPQKIGALFPAELQEGVSVIRTPAVGTDRVQGDPADYYQIEVLQLQDYQLILHPGNAGEKMPTMTLWAGETQQATISSQPGVYLAHLRPGKYTIEVRWPEGSLTADYRLNLSLLGTLEPPAPLTTGPAPILTLKLASDPVPTRSAPPSAGGATPAPATSTPSNPSPSVVVSPASSPAVGGTDSVRFASTLAASSHSDGADLFGALGTGALGADGRSASSTGGTRVAQLDVAGPRPIPTVGFLTFTIQGGGTGDEMIDNPTPPPVSVGSTLLAARAQVSQWMAGSGAAVSSSLRQLTQGMEDLTASFSTLAARGSPAQGPEVREILVSLTPEPVTAEASREKERGEPVLSPLWGALLSLGGLLGILQLGRLRGRARQPRKPVLSAGSDSPTVRVPALSGGNEEPA